MKNPPQSDIRAALENFINAPGWAAARELLQLHPELLGREVEQLVGQLLRHYPPDSREHRAIAESGLVLARCRAEGIEAAFADRILGPELQAILTALRDPAGRTDRARRAALAAAGLGMVSREGNPRLFATLQVYLGNALAWLHDSERALHQERAIAAFGEALAVLAEQGMVAEQQVVVTNLGKLHLERLTGDPEQNFGRAEALFEQALSMTADPVERADLLLHVGYARANHPSGSSEGRESALELYGQSLQLFSAAGSPRWVEAADGLAQLYLARSAGASAENIERACHLCRDALATVDKEMAPESWASLQTTLAAALVDYRGGDRRKVLEEALAACDAAQSVWSRDAYPLQWAAVRINRGRVCLEWPGNDLPHRFKCAAEEFEAALEVRRPEVSPQLWAETQMNLAIAHLLDDEGDLDAHREQAIALLETLEKAPVMGQLPLLRGMLAVNLTHAYLERRQGDRAENLERAIALGEAALGCWDPEEWPLDRVSLHLNLANAWLFRVRGDRESNQMRAYELNLELLERTKGRIDSALRGSVLVNLGNCWAERAWADPVQSLDAAIECYEEALELLPAEQAPEWRGKALAALGRACHRRQHGGRAENLARAAACYREALRMRPRVGGPLRWALLTGDLAAVLADGQQGDRADCQERALRRLRRAGTVLRRLGAMREWASNRHNLGAIYAERLRGDPVANKVLAIEAYEAALAGRPQASAPGEWAETAFNLAGALCQRPDGNRAQHLERAVALYREVLALRDREREPLAWAAAQQALGYALLLRRHGERAQNVEEAIEHLKLSIDIPWQEAAAVQKVASYARLGDAHLQRPLGDRLENLRAAAGCYDTARKLVPREQLPWSWAESTHNFGRANALLAEAGEPGLHPALEAYRQALEIYTLEAAPAEHRIVMRNLGHLHFNQRDWSAAADAYAAALHAGDLLFAEGGALAGRLAQLRESRDIPVHLAWCLVQLERAEEAVVCLEQGRTRVLAEMFGSDPAGSKGDPHPARLRAHLRERVRALERQAREDPRSYPEAAKELPALRRELARLAEEAGENGPDIDAIRRFAAQAGQPVVYLGATAAGTAMLVVTGDAVVPELLPLRDEATADERAERYIAGILGGDPTQLSAAINAAMGPLAHHLVEPMVAALARYGHRRAVLIPSGRLGLFPLPALAPEPFILTVAPSARTAAGSLAERQRRAGNPDRFIGLVDASAAQKPLPWVGPEVDAAASCFSNATMLTGMDELGRQVPGCTVLHAACHGRFEPAQPLDSALMLADSERLTVGALLDGRLDLGSLRLVVLTACQSALGEYEEHPDEALGFPLAFQQAGVPGVIGCLWPVSDLATGLLFTRFYQEFALDPDHAAAALRRAQQWLRTAPGEALAAMSRRSAQTTLAGFRARRWFETLGEKVPFAEPYYWAGFVHSGAE